MATQPVIEIYPTYLERPAFTALVSTLLEQGVSFTMKIDHANECGMLYAKDEDAEAIASLMPDVFKPKTDEDGDFVLHGWVRWWKED